ncbi:MAG: methyltransferase domain-containing protein, partial [Gemmatimonadetes bacterium]|nr:methyltransferase domain-containing protein [Gemmatimonadota bacterium]
MPDIRPSAVDIVCPHDSTVLHWDDAGLTCPHCGRDWERDGRIPLFTEAPGETVATANAFADSAGADSIPAAADEPNTDWRFLLPLTAETRVLVVGFGTGRIATELAPDVRSVTVLHADLPTLRALELRIRHESHENVAAVLSTGALPFPPGSFDLI